MSIESNKRFTGYGHESYIICCEECQRNFWEFYLLRVGRRRLNDEVNDYVPVTGVRL